MSAVESRYQAMASEDRRLYVIFGVTR
jgi:hypothetical protein